MQKSLLKSEFESLARAQDDGWAILDLEDYEIFEENTLTSTVSEQASDFSQGRVIQLGHEF